MNLTTTYLGLELPHPFIAGASPMADTLDMAKRVEDAGAAALVMRSLFEEQLTIESLAAYAADESADAHGEARSYMANPPNFVLGPDEYLEQLHRLKEAISIPVFASLNGRTPGFWLQSARDLQEAGADALEMNLYDVPQNLDESSADLEERDLEIVSAVRHAIEIPLAVKLSPFYTSLAGFAHRLEGAHVDGLVLFNRFFETDLDIEALEVKPHMQLSSSSELLLRLRWLAILSPQLPAMSLAVTGGVHAAEDAVKALMCGATAVQMVSSLLQKGPKHLAHLRHDLIAWMEKQEYASLDQMRGSMNIRRCPDPSAWSRTHYMRQLQTWTRR
jgi:dihydroorotate dehydrogenase (fumarate)